MAKHNTSKRKTRGPISTAQHADLKCKDCGSTKFSVHVRVHRLGAIETVELECADCAVTQVSIGPDVIEDEYITTTLEDK